LAKEAEKVDSRRDAKLGELKRLIGDKVANPDKTIFGSPNRKVVVFTAFADRAEHLYTVSVRPSAGLVAIAGQTISSAQPRPLA